jgi:plasmid stability protein
MTNNILLTNVDGIVMQALRKRAKEHNWTIEDEVMDVLVEALKRPQRRSFEEVLASMPDVGDDEDFDRKR